MDRIDAMKVFVAALDEGSLAGAGRKLGRSPAAVSRAVAFLEGQVGVELLHRTTRSSKLSEVGERYALVCRRLLTDLNEAEIMVASQSSAPGGILALTAPVLVGEEVLRPILDDFLDQFASVNARLMLLDRTVNLIDEGVDAALRVGELPNSSMIAIRVGQVRRVVVAAPLYLAKHPEIEAPGDLGDHQVIACSETGLSSWSFPRLTVRQCRGRCNSLRASLSTAHARRSLRRPREGVSRAYSRIRSLNIYAKAG